MVLEIFTTKVPLTYIRKTVNEELLLPFYFIAVMLYMSEIN